jgi:hypothetical protein
MGFAGRSAGRRDSGVRRVADFRGTYETVGRIESRVVARLRVCRRHPRIGIKRLRLSGSCLRLSGISPSGPRVENVDTSNC